MPIRVTGISDDTSKQCESSPMPSKKKNNRNSVGKSPKVEDDEEEVPKKVAAQGWCNENREYR
jgi:hypothetical protein